MCYDSLSYSLVIYLYCCLFSYISVLLFVRIAYFLVSGICITSRFVVFAQVRSNYVGLYQGVRLGNHERQRIADIENLTCCFGRVYICMYVCIYIYIYTYVYFVYRHRTKQLCVSGGLQFAAFAQAQQLSVAGRQADYTMLLMI